MLGFFVTFAIGIVIIVIGISNYKGNIETLHSYHRNYVRDEDRLPFGRLLALGMFIIGGGVIVFSIASAISVIIKTELLVLISSGIMLLSIAIGIVITFYAIKKYNGGIIR